MRGLSLALAMTAAIETAACGSPPSPITVEISHAPSHVLVLPSTPANPTEDDRKICPDLADTQKICTLRYSKDQIPKNLTPCEELREETNRFVMALTRCTESLDPYQNCRVTVEMKVKGKFSESGLDDAMNAFYFCE